MRPCFGQMLMSPSTLALVLLEYIGSCKKKSLAASNCSARQWRIELIEINCSKGTNNNTDDGLGKF